MSAQPPPDRIGRYEIVSEIGRGSMGRVYLARDPNVDREVALKVMAAPHLRGGDGAEEEARRRFLHEARAAGRLSHPGIVMVLDADSDPETGAPYIAMELVAGRSLEEMLAEYRRLVPARAVALVGQAARALAYAHAQGIVHRDVKPTNILVAASGAVKLADFGIAKMTAGRELTLPGSVLGSPYYMSPEQARGEPLDRRSDLFSLGSVLYRALTGVVPFGGEEIPSVLYKVVHVEPRPARLRAPGLPASLEHLLDRALAKERGERFQDGAAMAAALDAVAEELRGGRPAAAGEGGRQLPAVQTARPHGAAGGADASPAPSPETASAPAGTATVALTSPPTRPGDGIAAGSSAAGPQRASAVPSSGPGHESVARPGAAGSGGAAAVVPRGLGDAAAGVPPASSWDARARPSGRGRGPARVVPVATVLSVLTLGAVIVSTLFERAAQPPPPAPAQVDQAPDRAASAPAPPSPAPAEAAASLLLVYNDRLTSATLTLWIDGERAWSERVAGSRGVVQRVVGRERRFVVPVPAGEHSVRLRIVGAAPGIEVDATGLVRGRFEADGRRVLRAALNPLNNHLRLSWMG